MCFLTCTHAAKFFSVRHYPKAMPRPPTVLKPKRRNFYLPDPVVEEAAKKASLRYGISVSELIARLLVKENRHPKGLCHVRPAELSPVRG